VTRSLAHADRLANALPVQWLPVEVDIEVIEGVKRALAPADWSALISERQRQEMGSALYKSFVSAVIKLFGLSPATFIRHLDRGWRQILVDCGAIEVESLEPRSGVALLRELPEMCLASDPWIDALVPGMRVLYELIRTPGDVAVARRGNDIELRFTW
jgi:hypothetical protein